MERFDLGSVWGFLVGFLEGGWMLTRIWDAFGVGGRETLRHEAEGTTMLAVRDIFSMAFASCDERVGQSSGLIEAVTSLGV